MYRILFFGLVFGVLTPAVEVSCAVAACDAIPGFDYHGDKIWKLPNSPAYFYMTTRMTIDADGAPNAYHPQDKGIDALAHAGFPRGNWKAILVVNPANLNEPYVQKDGEFAGYFVSQTKLQDQSLPVTDVRKYVDSRLVPYIVFPGGFFAFKGTGDFGDVGVALNIDNGKESPFIIADVGPHTAPLGEVSIRLAENLGGMNVNPRTGAGRPKGRFVYLIFPGTKSDPAWPVSNEQLQRRTQEELAGIGGWERIRSCVKPH
jgi:hypothetical protein